MQTPTFTFMLSSFPNVRFQPSGDASFEVTNQFLFNAVCCEVFCLLDLFCISSRSFRPLVFIIFFDVSTDQARFSHNQRVCCTAFCFSSFALSFPLCSANVFISLGDFDEAAWPSAFVSPFSSSQRRCAIRTRVLDLERFWLPMRRRRRVGRWSAQTASVAQLVVCLFFFVARCSMLLIGAFENADFWWQICFLAFCV